MSIKPNIAIFGALLNRFEIHENIYVASQVKSTTNQAETFSK